MPANITIDGVPFTVCKLDNGHIRVSSPSPQFNALHGPATEGEFWHEVHPVQKHQYEYWNQMLPAEERISPPGVNLSAKPWWSAAAGERGGLRD
jgi:hypothetical protein